MILVHSNVVLLAPAIHARLFTQASLQKSGFLPPDEAIEVAAFTDDVVQVTTPKVAFLAFEGQLQLHLRDGNDDTSPGILARLVGLVKATPLPEYTALGLNFTWHHTPESESVAEYTRRYFGLLAEGPGSAFSSPDAHFGWYASQNVGSFRMKMDVRPIVAQAPSGEKLGRVQVVFNFHRDFNADSDVETVIGCLSEWSGLKSEARATLYKMLGVTDDVQAT